MKLILYLFVFLAFGEILIRIDEKIAPFSHEDQVKIAIKMEESKESKMVSANNVPLDDTTLRIMV
ncbi:MAG: hypothetical protein H0X41_05270, partial [Chitinophagaceae bacterium]|nr:hypothetical protein [Chitinophagaceae bacterium]